MPFLDFDPMPPYIAVAVFMVLLVAALIIMVSSWRHFTRPGATSLDRERSIGTWASSAVACVVFAMCAAGSMWGTR